MTKQDVYQYGKELLEEAETEMGSGLGRRL